MTPQQLKDIRRRLQQKENKEGHLGLYNNHRRIQLMDGEEYGTYSLGKDQTISINDTNVCEIKDGKAHMISATCPDHLCMKQREIDEKGGTIVCLPNKVVIEGSKSADSTDSSDELSIDAVT